MKYRLLDLIVCPYCSKRLSLKVLAEKKNHYLVSKKNRCKICTFKKKEACKECFNTEITEAILECSCRRIYPVIRGIPRMLPDDFMNDFLEKEVDFAERYRHYLKGSNRKIKDDHKNIKKSTVERFGYEWKNFSKLYESYENQFLDWIYPVNQHFFAGKLVLDAGCGTGRHAYYSAKYGAETVAFDFSDSVEVAYKNTLKFPLVHIIHADIYNMPFRAGRFDYAYCIGVLHHLPGPKQAFDNLVSKIKKGGTISVWVYGKEGNYLLKLMDPIRKQVISKLPIGLTYKLSFIAMLGIHPLTKLIYKPMNSSKSTRKIAEKILPQNSFFNYLGNFKFEQNHSILFDQLLAPIAFYYTKQEFERWFDKPCLSDVKITWRNKNSWRGMAVKWQ
ncbi:MAG TPA: methyltransferase domain-containing protein [Candidatus Nanoarchaeia archaeon]|nr:methyltransferase domain-containing protein [Candidatus Nanoarchaeia archaeon]